LASSQALRPQQDRLLKLIELFRPGGPMNAMMRIVGQELNAAVKQPAIVETRAGAGGTFGPKAVATAEPDGYTLLWHALDPAGAQFQSRL
jgi:tripartite-type tricarboxylate transporter receptor subunit TctC